MLIISKTSKDDSECPPKPQGESSAFCFACGDLDLLSVLQKRRSDMIMEEKLRQMGEGKEEATESKGYIYPN